MAPAAKKKGPTILEQILGAVVGGGLALSLYYGYEYGMPVVTAWLTVPQKQHSVQVADATRAQENLKEVEVERIAARTREIVDRFGGEVARRSPSYVEALQGHAAADAMEEQGASSDGTMEEHGSRGAASSASMPDIAAMLGITGVSSSASVTTQVPTQSSSAAMRAAESEYVGMWPTASSSAASRAALAANAPALPSSGLGVWMAGLLALSAVTLYWNRAAVALVLERMRG